MLTSTLLLLFAAPPNDAWLERLDFPQLAQANVNLAVSDADLGIESDDLGFPEDPRQRVAEAFERAQGGDRSARTLHQAVSGIITLRDGENFKRVMPACLSAYVEELKAAPQDTGLRSRFARVLISGGVITRDDRFFQDAETQLGMLLEAEPDNWRWRCEYTKLQATRVLYLGGTDSDSLWLARGIEASEGAIKLAPLEVEPRWRSFHANYLAVVRDESSGGSGIYQRLTDLADGLIAEAREIEQPLLGLVGQSYWAIAKLGIFIADSESGVPAEDRQVQERLETFRGSLQAAPEGELRTGAARAWWGLSALFGTPEQVADGMDLAIDLGLARSDAHMLALMGLHKRAEDEAAAAVALEFEECAEGDNAWRALTVYRHETGDDAGALEAQARVKGVDPALRLARAQLRLHTGDVEVARDELKALVSEVAGAPMAGEVGHSYGVCLALTGDLEGARLQLSIASRLLGEEDGAGARATLEDLR